MALYQIPNHSQLRDAQFIQVLGPNGITTGYQYDAELRTLYYRDSQVVYPSFHGPTHIAEDPVPVATCDSPGLMSADDKCKVDAILQTRLGVLGFQGAGFPNDGGWMQGDIILAAGTEFISLERIGNVVRFTVDSPIPLNCACESCNQIFWVQDETEVAAIRPPTCAGKLVGTDVYGEMKVYLFPESTIVDTTNPSKTLGNKGIYPALIFKRYDDAITPGLAEFELILKRNSLNSSVTEIGWAFTPGARGIPEVIWYTGLDLNGNAITFKMDPNVNADGLGALLYKGILITKKPAVIVDYTNEVLSTNVYMVREWNLDKSLATGDCYSARNVWQIINPQNPQSGVNPQVLVLDQTIDLLPVGTLVDLYAYQVGEIAGQTQYRYFFSKKPSLNPNYVWTNIGSVQFGDIVVAREEIENISTFDPRTSAITETASRDFEPSQWGLTGLDDPLLMFDEIVAGGTAPDGDYNSQHRAIIDTLLPGMKIVKSIYSGSNFSERPVYLWHRESMTNALVRADIGRPEINDYVGVFPPIDMLLRARIDSTTEKYMKVVSIGNINGLNYVMVCGADFTELPPFGTIRILNPGADENQVYNYNKKFVFPSEILNPVLGVPSSLTISGCDVLVLANGYPDNKPYTGNIGDVVELLHQDYDNPVVRMQYGFDRTTNLVTLQFFVGHLDMSLPYQFDAPTDEVDDFVRGLAPGYAVSAVYSQSGVWSGVGTQPAATPRGFKFYDGGAVSGGDSGEYWNKIEVMLRDSQVWIWWNGLLIPPSPALNSLLSTPVSINTPFYPIDFNPTNQPFGKCGLKLWPGAKIRRMDIKSQVILFSEFSYGQITIAT